MADKVQKNLTILSGIAYEQYPQVRCARPFLHVQQFSLKQYRYCESTSKKGGYYNRDLSGHSVGAHTLSRLKSFQNQNHGYVLPEAGSIQALACQPGRRRDPVKKVIERLQSDQHLQIPCIQCILEETS
jgi:hypothetical protein